MGRLLLLPEAWSAAFHKATKGTETVKTGKERRRWHGLTSLGWIPRGGPWVLPRIYKRYFLSRIRPGRWTMQAVVRCRRILSRLSADNSRMRWRECRKRPSYLPTRRCREPIRLLLLPRAVHMPSSGGASQRLWPAKCGGLNKLASLSVGPLCNVNRWSALPPAYAH